ncbi:serine protease [Pseudomonas fluorescens]|uniref:S1 family peptidase n=1 Tax=Pseudomonas fluorescens TaxID=294 RepID=UPI001786F2B0|nr:serine protease [Pseudomonas fluorescens]
MTIINRLGLGMALALATTPALASQQGTDSSPAPLTLTNAQGENSQWNGIGHLNRPDHSQCIAALVDSRDPLMPSSGPAYVVTAGHCVDIRNGVIGHDLPIEGTVSFNYFVDTQDQRRTVALKRRVWSSIQGTDLALLELDASLEVLMAQGLTPLTLGDSPPPGSQVRVVGELSSPGLGLATCSEVDVPILLQHPRLRRNIKGNDCPGVGPGSSGSPVINDNAQLVSVINSIVVSSDVDAAPCDTNSPCQLGEDEITGKPLKNTAVPLNRLKGCFTAGVADLTLDSCQLLPGFQLQAQRWPRLVTKIATDAEGNDRVPGWDLSFALDTPRYRYKAVRDPLACEDPQNYSGTIPAAENRIDDPIGPEPGWHFLCLIGVDSPDHQPSPALMANSLSLAVQLLPAVPVPAPDMSIEARPNGNVKVTWRTDPPHLSNYRVKRGPPATTDCDDPAGLRLLRHHSYEFKAAQLPLKLCTVSEDLIDQRSAVRTDLLQSASTDG